MADIDVNALPSNFYVIAGIVGTKRFDGKGDKRPQLCVSLGIGTESYKFYIDAEVAAALRLEEKPMGTMVMMSFRPYVYKSEKGGAVLGFTDVQFLDYL